MRSLREGAEHGTPPTGLASFRADPKRLLKIVLDTLSHFHQRGGTVILVTHEQSAADRAEATVFLESGHLRVGA